MEGLVSFSDRNIIGLDRGIRWGIEKIFGFSCVYCAILCTFVRNTFTKHCALKFVDIGISVAALLDYSRLLGVCDRPLPSLPLLPRAQHQSGSLVRCSKALTQGRL